MREGRCVHVRACVHVHKSNLQSFLSAGPAESETEQGMQEELGVWLWRARQTPDALESNVEQI